MRLHIIYDCAGHSLDRAGWHRLRHFARALRDRQLTACRPNVSVSVAK